MTWAALIANGRGTTSYRLEIERLEEQFVTAVDMASATRKPWLNIAGGQLKCSTNPVTGELDVSGLHVWVIDKDQGATAIFAAQPDYTTWLTAELSPSATSMNVRSTTGWPSSGYLWIDSEAIAYTSTTATTFAGLTRGALGSLAQTHYIATGGLARYPEVTSSITSIAGCRARLYGYGQNDDPQGDGTQIWLGVVTNHPNFDGKQWNIPIDPITSVLSRPLANDLEEPTTPRGIHYDWRNRLVLSFQEDTGNTVLSVGFPSEAYPRAFFENNDDFASYVNAALAAEIVSEGWDAFSCSIRVIPDGDSTWYLGVTTDGTTVRNITPEYPTIDPVFTDRATTITGATALAASGVERYWMPQPTSLPGAGSVPRGYLGASTPGFWEAFSETFPFNELYLAGVELGSSVDCLAIEWAAFGPYPKSESQPLVLSSDAATNSVRLEEAYPPDASMSAVTVHAWTAPSAPKIRLGRTYTRSGNVYTMLVRLIGLAPTLLNTGAVPDLRAGDLDGTSWNLIDGADQPRIVRARSFTSFSPAPLFDIVRQELLLAGFFMGVNGAGKIAIAPIRAPAQTEAPDMVIPSVVVSGGLPSWEPSAFGLVNRVVLERGYSALEDDYTTGHVAVRNVAQFGRNPRSRTMTIEPKSIPAAGIETLDEVLECAQRVFAAFAGPYAILNLTSTLQTLNDATIGAVVSVTSPHVPDPETGEVGITGRRFIVLGREVNLRNGAVKLRLYTSTLPTVGYAPESRITAETNTSGDTWELTLDSSYFPAGSTAEDWFAVNDIVQARRWDSTSTAMGDGTVTAVASNVVTVAFNAPVALGSDDWFLTYLEASNTLAASQYAYAFLGDADMTVNKDGSIEVARRFA